MSDYVPRPGDAYLVKFGGWFGWWITMLQGVVAGDWSRYSHAGIFLEDGLVAQSGGHGVVIADASRILADRPLAILAFPTWGDRAAALTEAHRLIGTPYDYWAYLFIGLAKLHIRPAWLRRLVASDKRLICSAYVDKVWAAGGVQCFTDGRISGAVTPGDLAYVGTILNVGTGPYPAKASA